MDLMEEARRVQRAQADPAEFVWLYDRYVAQIYAYVQRQTHDEPTTQDIVASTFTQALSHLPDYEWRGVRFGAWLYKIARNELRRHYRRSWRWLPLPDVLKSEGRVEQQVADEQQLHLVRQAMLLLSARDQELLQLHFDEGLSHDEIGVVLDTSARNVAVRLHRALKRLRQRLLLMNVEGVTHE